MKNRVSKYPGRVLVTPDDGSPPFYATLTRADKPTQEGSPLNKTTLLTDETATLYGLDGDAVPNEVLAEIYNRMQWQCIEVHNFTIASDTRPFKKTIGLTTDLRQYNEFIVVLAQKSDTQNDTSNNDFYAFIDDEVVSAMRIRYSSSRWTYETSLPIAVLKLSDNEHVIGGTFKATSINCDFGAARTTAPENLTLSTGESYIWMRAGSYKVLIFARGKR